MNDTTVKVPLPVTLSTWNNVEVLVNVVVLDVTEDEVPWVKVIGIASVTLEVVVVVRTGTVSVTTGLIMAKVSVVVWVCVKTCVFSPTVNVINIVSVTISVEISVNSLND